MKTCCKCKIEKVATEFYVNKRSSQGLSAYCKPCHKEYGKAKKKLDRANPEYRAKEAEKKREYREKNRQAHKDYMKQWHLKNAEAQAKYRAAYQKSNPEYFVKYRKENSGKINAKTRKRQVAKLQRTPQWLDSVDLLEMDCIYTYAASLRRIGLKYEVDHIIPLQGKRASGLHVPSNLQVITEKENRSKHNRMEIA